MKHKAQVSLNYLVAVSCPKRTNCKECDIKDVCNSFGKGYISTIQLSIDNQLTVDEIRTIISCLSVACFDEDTFNSIFDKLKKQKEMWDVER